jgi:hypothetical protein
VPYFNVDRPCVYSAGEKGMRIRWRANEEDGHKEWMNVRGKI